MNSECREFLRKYIQVYFEKNPASYQKDVREWLNSGYLKFKFKEVKKSTLSMFITYLSGRRESVKITFHLMLQSLWIICVASGHHVQRQLMGRCMLT